VAAKWVLPEEYSENAFALLERSAADKSKIVGPPHLTTEVMNAIYQQLRRENITIQEADESLETFLSLDIWLAEPPDLYKRALALAKTHGLDSVYDAMYLALSAELGTDLWTADKHLKHRMDGQFAGLRLIEDFPTD
jgi:predicted nucleic acid-binding protein